MNRGGHSNLLQDSCLENPVDRGAWRATVYGVTLSWIWLKQLSMHACIHVLRKSNVHITSVLPRYSLGFPGGSVVKNPPANVQEQVQSLVWEDPTWLGATKPMHSYWACVLETRSPSYWAHRPQLLKPPAPEPTSTRREATAMRSPRTAARD